LAITKLLIGIGFAAAFTVQITVICARLERATMPWWLPIRRLGARILGALGTVTNPDHGGADSGEVVFLYIASGRRELPLLPRLVRFVGFAAGGSRRSVRT